jgi:hypothetical protein
VRIIDQARRRTQQQTEPPLPIRLAGRVAVLVDACVNDGLREPQRQQIGELAAAARRSSGADAQAQAGEPDNRVERSRRRRLALEEVARVTNEAADLLADDERGLEPRSPRSSPACRGRG